MKNNYVEESILLKVMEYLHDTVGCAGDTDEDYCYQQLMAFEQIRKTLESSTAKVISAEEVAQLLAQIAAYAELGANQAFQTGFKEGVRLSNEMNRL